VRRDDRTVSDEERRIHVRAAALYEHLAAEDPVRIHVLDRRIQDNAAALNSMQDWISTVKGARHAALVTALVNRSLMQKMILDAAQATLGRDRPCMDRLPPLTAHRSHELVQRQRR
jgi:hypothetical protein